MNWFAGVITEKPDQLTAQTWLLRDRNPVNRSSRLYTNGRLLMARGEHFRVSANGNACAWDGDLHNVRQLLSLSSRGAEETVTEADLALAAYEGAGVPGLARLVGDWSLVIWDAARELLILASDYAGARPLFYYISAQTVAWSSSLEHMARFSSSNELNPLYAASLLFSGNTQGRTPYPGVRCAPCGAALVVSRGNVQEIPFWHPPVGEVRLGGDSEYEERFRELFREAVAVRLNTPRPVCAELSGGLDSSSIVCMASRLIADGDVTARRLVTFSYLHTDSLDAPFLAAVERFCDTPAVHLNIEHYPPICTRMKGPAPLWWEPRFQEIADQTAGMGAAAFLTGQLGDLVTGNWLDDTEQVADSLIRGRFAGALAEAYAWSRALDQPIWSVLRGAVRSAVRDRAASWEPQSANEDSLTPEMRNTARRLNAESGLQPQKGWALPSRRKHLGALASMLQARVVQRPAPLSHLSYSHPFLHRPLLEFLMTVPSSVACQPNYPRRLMRLALRGIVPEVVLQRRSKGNYEGEFIRALRPLATILLRDTRSMRLVQLGFLDPVSLAKRLTRLIEGLPCNEPQLRRVILLEFWLNSRATADGQANTRTARLELVPPMEKVSMRGKMPIPA